MTEQELKEQLKRYEWALAETEALVMSHEGHISKLEGWQKRALPWLCEMKPIIAEKLEFWQDRSREEIYQRELDELNTLIKEGEKE